jgi:hypothetical protein
VTVVDLLSVGVVLAVAVVYAVDTILDRLVPEPPEGTKNRAAVQRIGSINTELSFAAQIRTCEKASTIRYGLGTPISPGDRLQLVDADTHEEIATVTVT